MRSLAMPNDLFIEKQKLYEKDMKKDRETEKRESCYFQLKNVSQIFAATVRCSQSPVVISRAKRHSSLNGKEKSRLRIIFHYI